MYPKILLIQDKVITSNLDPNSNFRHNLSTCHWNLNNVSTQNFPKLVLLKAYNSSYAIICLSDTYLNSFIPMDESEIQFEGYRMIVSYLPTDTRRVGVCISHKHSFST